MCAWSSLPVKNAMTRKSGALGVAPISDPHSAASGNVLSARASEELFMNTPFHESCLRAAAAIAAGLHRWTGHGAE